MNPTQNPYRITQKDRPPVGQGAVTGPAPDGSGAGGASSLNQLNDAEDVRAIEALSTTGLLARTAAATWALRTLTAPAAGLTIADGDGVGGDPTFALANDLAALEGLSTTGWAKRTADDTWSVSASIPAPEVSYDHTVSGLTATDVKAAIDELAAMSAGLADGDYGDVTVSSSGTVMTVDNVAWANVSSKPTTLAGYGITDAQPLDADLSAIAGLTSAADRLPYFSGSGTAALAVFTSFGRSLVDDANAAAGLATLGAAASGLITASGLTMATTRILGRETAGAGAIEELSVGSSLSLSASTLDAIQDIRPTATPQFASQLLLAPSGATLARMRLSADSEFSQFLFENAAASYKGYVGYIGTGYTGDASRQGCVELGTATGGSVTLRPGETEALRATSSLVTLGVPLKTPAPSGGTAGEWKLGTYSSGYVRIDIGGTPYDLSTSASGVPSGAITASGLTMATARLLGRTTAGTGAIEELDAAAVRGLLGVATTDTPQFTGLQTGSGDVVITSGDSATAWKGQAAVASRGLYLQRYTPAAPSAFEMLGVGGTLTAQVMLARTGGTGLTSLSATQAGQFSRYGARGYDGTNWTADSEIQFIAAENFTATARGCGILFLTTLLGTTSPAERGRISGAGNFLVGITSDTGLSGAGNIRAGSAFMSGAPSGGTAQPWKLGSYVAGAPSATGYAQIEINGTAYKVLVST